MNALIKFFLLCTVAIQVVPSLGSSQVRVRVNGQDLYTSDDSDCFGGGGADPRWRVRVSVTTTSNWVEWNEDRDGISGTGWKGISKSNVISSTDVGFFNNIYLELNAWEDDNFFCGGNDGDCGGYGGRVTVQLTSRAPCQFHTVETIRTCNSDGDTITWGARVQYYYEYKEGSVISCSPPTPLPTRQPTKQPTSFPTDQPTSFPTPNPSAFPSTSPSQAPTQPVPSSSPSMSPTNFTTPNPTSSSPTFSPTMNPTSSPAEPTASIVPTSSPNIAAGSGGEFIIISAGAAAGIGALAVAFFVYRRRRHARRMKSNILESKVTSFNPTYGGEEDSDKKSAFEYESITKLEPENITSPTKAPPGLGFTRESIEANNAQANNVQTSALPAGSAQNVLRKLNFNNGGYEGRQMTVLYDFEAEQEDELSATSGQELLCLDKKEDWYVARNLETGESGIIPANFVELH